MSSVLSISSLGSSSFSSLQQKFDDEKKDRCREQKVQSMKEDCKYRRELLDETFKRAMSKNGNTSFELENSFSTPQGTSKRYMRNRHGRFNVTDSPADKFSKTWHNFTEYP